MVLLASHGKSQTNAQNTSISSITGLPSLSVKKQELSLTSITLDSGAPHLYRFFIQGGLHGNETLTTEFVSWLEDRIIRGQSPLNSLPAGTVIDLLANANPDSHGRYRYNANNVNLNRNFSILWGVSKEPMGNKAFSEPETQAVKNLFEKRNYLAAVDVHGYLNWVVLPTKIKKSKRYERWIGSVNKHVKILPGYLTKVAGDLGDGGAFEDWAFWEQGTLAICLELRYPARFFNFKKEINLDSFLSYESFIHKIFLESLTITPMKDEIASNASFQNGDFFPTLSH